MKLTVNGCEIDNSKDMAEQFNTYFSTIVDILQDGLRHIPSDLSKLKNFIRSRKELDVSFSIPAITSAQVNKIIMNISPHKVAGIDKIGARFLRIAAPAVVPSIARLINFSFTTGKFPKRWKTAMVTPLLKNGADTDRCNYRPISVLPVGCYVESH